MNFKRSGYHLEIGLVLDQFYGRRNGCWGLNGNPVLAGLLQRFQSLAVSQSVHVDLARGGSNLNCPLPQQNASLLYKYTILGKNDQIKCNPPTLTLPPKFLWKLPWPYKYGYDMLVTAPRQMTAGGHSLISPFSSPGRFMGSIPQPLNTCKSFNWNNPKPCLSWIQGRSQENQQN